MGAATRHRVLIRIVHEYVVDRDFVVLNDVKEEVEADLYSRGEQAVNMTLTDEMEECGQEPLHTVEVTYD